ncbi:hypothetical protein ACFPU1_06550 [Thalassorhabdus alkalitolerans]|uniref:Uncharacterized protein n=1 Tax=Thalassorhabdus alkalitolerans TaxID=2282697 RepID=A0ABW0YJA7_9BACI|nr:MULTISPECIES: hypothetical protein [Bacillaceae]
MKKLAATILFSFLTLVVSVPVFFADSLDDDNVDQPEEETYYQTQL